MGATFAGRRALVTGGTSGIGAAIALALAAEGCEVTACGVTLHEVEPFAAEHPEIQTRVLDVTEDAAINDLAADWEGLDVLINAAGILRRNGAEFAVGTFAEVLDVNLLGTLRACLACRPLLARHRGCILNVASMLSFFGSGTVPAYSASKGGVAQLTKSLAIAWAPDGIRVNAIAPGWIATPMTAALRNDDRRSRAILDRTPMGRWGQPEELAGPALFLCSPSASFITGAILPVDGGYSIA